MNKLFNALLSTMIVFTSCQSSKVGKYTKEELPEGFKYSIVNDQSDSTIGKNQLTVSIPLKVNEGQLATIAEDIYKSKPEQKRFYISYLLPGMDGKNGAWATSNFDPELEIEILGSTERTDVNIDNLISSIKGDIIGKWSEKEKTNLNFVFYKKGDKPYAKVFSGSGEISDDELKTKKLSSGIKYEVKESNTTGEYYVINSDGNLDLYNSENVKFATGLKL